MKSPRVSPEQPGLHIELELLRSIVVPWNARWAKTTGDTRDLISLVNLGCHLVRYAAMRRWIADPGFIGGNRAGIFLEPIWGSHHKPLWDEARIYAKHLADARRPVWEAEQAETARLKAELKLMEVS